MARSCGSRREDLNQKRSRWKKISRSGRGVEDWISSRSYTQRLLSCCLKSGSNGVIERTKAERSVSLKKLVKSESAKVVLIPSEAAHAEHIDT